MTYFPSWTAELAVDVRGSGMPFGSLSAQAPKAAPALADVDKADHDEETLAGETLMYAEPNDDNDLGLVEDVL